MNRQDKERGKVCCCLCIKGSCRFKIQCLVPRFPDVSVWNREAERILRLTDKVCFTKWATRPGLFTEQGQEPPAFSCPLCLQARPRACFSEGQKLTVACRSPASSAPLLSANYRRAERVIKANTVTAFMFTSCHCSNEVHDAAASASSSLWIPYHMSRVHNVHFVNCRVVKRRAWSHRFPHVQQVKAMRPGLLPRGPPGSSPQS